MNLMTFQSRKSLYASIVACAVLTLAILPFALTRLVGGDEGFYLFAGKLIAQGNVVYRDFFYPQMPYMPYLYGGWMKVFGYTWEVGRVLSALLTIGLGLVIYHHIRREFGAIYGILTTLLFALSPWILCWFTMAKTYSPSMLCLVGGYVLLHQRRGRWPTFLAGLLCAIAVGLRLYLVVVAPLYLFMRWQQGARGKELFAHACAFTAGALVGGIPVLILAVTSWDSFWFNNLGFHLGRSMKSPEADWNDKFLVIQQLFALKPSEQLLDWHFPLLSLFTLGHVAVRTLQRKLPDVSVFFAAALFVVSTTPAPIYFQYYCVCVPFLLIASTYFIRDCVTASATLKPLTRNTLLPALGLCIGFVYLRTAATDYVRYTQTGIGVMGVYDEAGAKLWDIGHIKRISRFINKNTPAGGHVLAQWPGYLLEADFQAIPGTENHFGARAAIKLGVYVHEEYKVVSPRAMADSIKRREPDTVVLSPVRASALPIKVEGVRGAGYRQVVSEYGATVFVKE